MQYPAIGRGNLKALVKIILMRLGLFGTVISVLNKRQARKMARAALDIEPRSVVQIPGLQKKNERPIVMAIRDNELKDLSVALSSAVPDTLVLTDTSSRLSDAPAVLEKPDPSTFAGWLSLDQPEVKSAVATFVVGLESLGLLRGQMRPDQHLLLKYGQDATSIPTELGAATWMENGFAYFDAPPAVYSGVFDQSGTALTERPNQANWPKISMVMVSFNQANYLEQGIRSILDQNYPNLEFIMIDGGSSDGSVEILERYRDRFAVLVIEKDRGQSDGLTKGFDRATGEIVSWLNSDDLLIPGALFRVADAFRYYGVDMVVGGCRQVEEDGASIVLSHHTHLPFGRKILLPLQDLLNFDGRWLAGCFFFQPEVFFTRDIWLRSGAGLRLDLYYVLDYDLWIRMAAAGATIAHIPAYLASSRIHAAQKTTFGETPFVPEAHRLLAEYANGVSWKRTSVS